MAKVYSKDIIEAVNEASCYGADIEISTVGQLGDKLSPHSLVWCGDKYLDNLKSIEVGNVILSQNGHEFAKRECLHYKNVGWIVVENPRRTFAKILELFFAKTLPAARIEETARVSEKSSVHSSAYIGHNVVVEDDCSIGENVVILHNSTILEGTTINENVKIGCNCTIGGVGFGYERDKNGEYVLMPHIGHVLIEANVEIGNNVCIDRAVIGHTLIGENVKVDNLVHIAHGVSIGRNSLIIANAMVAGSVQIGENVWVAPSSSIIQKAEIGNNSLIGMGSTVLKDVDPSSIVVGNPAKPLRSK
ncbi:MAG: UDP-3-O-(3-hydroxymyristoyl)glucosamine N-acyltransferase [Crocinitomicaceae bacterium]|nr:UDP-3-O-(3-hydroxymyristoyl)glucosamine N-acyltransferase [Crocinitomicaceae bacterium]|tara:strand:- start:16463 stop:17374 length:912 start_codon:yes stop_codon:yes gene_type:complete